MKGKDNKNGVIINSNIQFKNNNSSNSNNYNNSNNNTINYNFQNSSSNNNNINNNSFNNINSDYYNTDEFNNTDKTPLLSSFIKNNNNNNNNNNMTFNNNNDINITTINNDNNKELKKNTLGLAQCISFSVSGVGPTTGILYVFPQIAAVAGTSTPFTLIIATFCCLSMASTISTFGKYISTSASFYSYVYQGLGKEMGFITGWLMLCGYLTLSVQTILQFASTTADVISRNSDFHFPWVISAAFVIVFICTFAYLGINPALKFSLLLVVGETIVIMIFTIIVVAKGGAEGNYPLAFTPVGENSGGVSGISRGLVFSVLVFIGFEVSATLGRESRNPKSYIPKAVVGSVLLTSLYITWSVYAMVVAIGPSNILNIASISSPAETVARKFVSHWFAIMVDCAGISSTFNVCTSSFNNLFRIIYSIGKSDASPLISKLSLTSKRFSTPIAAIIVFITFIIVSLSVIIAFFGIYTNGSWKIYGYLSYVGTIPLILVFIITNIAVIPYVKRSQRQDFNLFYHMLLPIFSALCFALVLLGNFFPDVPKSPYSYILIALAAVIGFGVLLMFYLRTKGDLLDKMAQRIGHEGIDDNIGTSNNNNQHDSQLKNNL